MGESHRDIQRQYGQYFPDLMYHVSMLSWKQWWLNLYQIDSMTVSWATHRLSGISAPVSATYSVSELEHQLTSAGCKALFTCVPLLELALEAAAKAGIPRKHVYLLELPVQSMRGKNAPADIRAVDQLIEDAARLNPLEPLRWDAGQGARQTAFLCSSSGTSGLPVSLDVPLSNLCKDIFLIHEKPMPIEKRQNIP